jgi:hypothetical protein
VADVYVGLCAYGHTCFDNHGGYTAPAGPAGRKGGRERTYCLNHNLDRLGVRNTRGEQITWTLAARSWVEFQGERVAA